MHRSRVSVAFGVVIASALVVSGAPGPVAGAPERAVWSRLQPEQGVVDIAGPRRDGRFLLAAAGKLWLFRIGSDPVPFATGYSTAPASEPYLALASQHRMPRAGCSFRRDDAYALETGVDPGVIRITREGVASRFADLPAGSDGTGSIAFDTGGRFGHRLLVAAVNADDRSQIVEFDCLGRARTIVADGPRVDGGAAIAPSSFGRFGGDLIAADEFSNSIYAFGPSGETRLVARPALPVGLDVGLESLGFVPSFRRFDLAMVAGRAGEIPEPPSDLVAVGAGALWRAGVRRGNLLAVAENPALTTVRIRCRRRCGSRIVAGGSLGDSAEGHVEFGSR